MRADWLVDGVYVEAAGMMGRDAYFEKMRKKRAPADLAGIELIVVEPNQVNKLEQGFARWLQTPRV